MRMVENQGAEVSPVKGCGCKKGCGTKSRNNCGCMKRGLPCGPSYKCNNTYFNCENPIRTIA
jgi:hypothetical protein